MDEGKEIGWLFGFSFWAVMFLPVALCCGLLGLLMAFGSWDSYRQANEVEAMQPLSAADVAETADGREVLVVGRIGASNETGFGALVAYELERLDSDSDADDELVTESDWETVRTETPALLVEIPGGSVWIEGSYRMESPPTELREGDQRYQGFATGDRVLALGTLVSTTEGKRLDADFLYGGTQAEYVQEKRELAALLPWCSSPFLLIAGVLLLVGILWVVLGVRAFRRRKQQGGAPPPPLKHV
jgi:hypothetical protein